MQTLIHAEKEILRTNWLPEKIKELLLRSSVAVNSLYVPLNERELIQAIAEEKNFPLSQIAYAHEVPPYFTRKGQYITPESLDLDAGKEVCDVKVPGLYGFIRHPNATYTLVMFIRGKVIDLTNPSRPRVDPNGENLRSIFDQYRRLTSLLVGDEEKKPVLRIVGALPGYAERLYVMGRFHGYSEEVEMLGRNNKNSARFVVAATQRLLTQYGLEESELILLGAFGALGRIVSESFPDGKKIDLTNKDAFPQNGKYLVLDMTGGGSFYYYREKLSPDALWLSESFPPPIGANSRNRIFHIQGVEGMLTPSFPFGYGNTPPCCMGIDDQSQEAVKILDLHSKRTQIA